MGFAETFKALSDPARREILLLLRDGRMSAGEIAGHFEMTGATVSYHLSVLKKADLVFETREKNFIYYELNTSVVEEVMLWLSQLKGDNHESHSLNAPCLSPASSSCCRCFSASPCGIACPSACRLILISVAK